MIDCFRVSLGDDCFAENSLLTTVNFTNLNLQGLEIAEGATPFSHTPRFSKVNLGFYGLCSLIGDLTFSEVFGSSGVANTYSEWSDFGCLLPEYYLKFDPANEHRLVSCSATTPTIHIPAHVQIIGTQAFAATSSTEVVFEKGSQLQSIEVGAFYNSRIRRIFLPSSLPRLPDNFLQSDNYIEVVDIESAIRIIPAGAFANAAQLQVVSINGVIILNDRRLDFTGSSINEIRDGAFKGVHISRVVIAPLMNLQNFTFSGLSEAEEIDFPCTLR